MATPRDDQSMSGTPRAAGPPPPLSPYAESNAATSPRPGTAAGKPEHHMIFEGTNRMMLGVAVVITFVSWLLSIIAPAGLWWYEITGPEPAAKGTLAVGASAMGRRG